MLHHRSLAVADLERSGTFYDATLTPLGFGRVWSDDDAIGYGPAGGGDKFAIKRAGSAVSEPPAGFHLAFAAPGRAAVEAFHRAELESGGPGQRPGYGPAYYAPSVLGPEGYTVEAVNNDARPV